MSAREVETLSQDIWIFTNTRSNQHNFSVEIATKDWGDVLPFFTSEKSAKEFAKANYLQGKPTKLKQYVKGDTA